MRGTYASDEVVDDVRLEDVAERDPVEEAEERFERRLDQARLLRLAEHFGAKLKDLAELAARVLACVICSAE
jgi:hypothetical protein